MLDSTAAWMSGNSGIKSDEDAGRANTGGIGSPEDDDPAKIIRILPARGVVESSI
jgi:hypothetical protein